MKRRIVITGGHHISALVLAKALRQKGYQVFWIGTRYPRWPEKTEGQEYKQVKASGFAFFNLRAGKFHKNFKDWWRVFFGFFRAWAYLFHLKPDLVFSFGGYLAVPVVLSAWFLGIPSFTHEQTRTAGLANRFLKFFVKKVFLTWSSSRKFFPFRKSVFVGLPVRKEIVFSRKTKLFPEKLPTILVAGGKQGSHVINSCIEEILEEVLQNFNLIHQCGSILEAEDFSRLSKKRNFLSLKKRYILKKFFSDQEMGENLATAHFFVGRAGAHIVYELALKGKPAIFIPLPFAFAQEQERNARLFTKHRAGKIILQEELNKESLLKAIREVEKNFNFYKKNAQFLTAKIRKDATDKIVEEIEKFSYEKKKRN